LGEDLCRRQRGEGVDKIPMIYDSRIIPILQGKSDMKPLEITYSIQKMIEKVNIVICSKKFNPKVRTNGTVVY